MGGIHPAYEFVKACLEKGKHCVTSNKALVDAVGSKLISIAREHHCNFYFEASVGGGIPVIRTIYHNYAGENLTEITGIMNGTTNFILTKMREKGPTSRKPSSRHSISAMRSVTRPPISTASTPPVKRRSFSVWPPAIAAVMRTSIPRYPCSFEAGLPLCA